MRNHPPLHAALNQVVDDDGYPTIDLGSILDSLSGSLSQSVESYCGSSVTVVHDGYPVTLSSPDPLGDETPNPAVTSLALPLAAVSALPIHGELVMFASTAGAFVDLAADLACATKSEPSSFALDAHLDRSVPDADMNTESFSTLHQAIGVLMAGGDTPEQARTLIRQVAGGANRNVTVAALGILTGIHRGSQPPGIGPANQAA